jgi:single-stranded DNA-binding protein
MVTSAVVENDKIKNGRFCAEFNIRAFRDDRKKDSKSDSYKIQAWGMLGQDCFKNLKKGYVIAVRNGKQTVPSYIAEKDGKPRICVQISLSEDYGSEIEVLDDITEEGELCT